MPLSNCFFSAAQQLLVVSEFQFTVCSSQCSTLINFFLVFISSECRLIFIDSYDRLIAYLAKIQSRPPTSSIRRSGYVRALVGLDSVVIGGRMVRVGCAMTNGSSQSIYLLLTVPFLRGERFYRKPRRRVMCQTIRVKKGFLGLQVRISPQPFLKGKLC